MKCFIEFKFVQTCCAFVRVCFPCYCGAKFDFFFFFVVLSGVWIWLEFDSDMIGALLDPLSPWGDLLESLLLKEYSRG